MSSGVVAYLEEEMGCQTLDYQLVLGCSLTPRCIGLLLKNLQGLSCENFLSLPTYVALS